MALRAERAAIALAAGVRWLLAALIPGLPWILRGQRVAGLIVLGLYAGVFARFMVVHQGTTTRTLRYWLPGFGTIQYEPVYLWLGLAIGIHIFSVTEHLRPVIQGRLQGVDWRARFILTLAVTLAVAAFMYFVLYGPLLG